MSPILVRGYNTLHDLFLSEMYDVQYDTASPPTHYGRSSTSKGSFAEEKCPEDVLPSFQPSGHLPAQVTYLVTFSFSSDSPLEETIGRVDRLSLAYSFRPVST